MRGSHVRAYCRYEWPRDHRLQRKWARRPALLRRYKRFVRHEAPIFWQVLYSDGRPLTEMVPGNLTGPFQWFEKAT